MSQAKEFCEWWRGFRGGTYYYVLDNGYCIPIAKYATKSVRKYEDEVCYYVEESKIANKAVLEISSANSGYIYIRPGAEFVDKCVDLPHLTHLERRFLKEWREYYIPMLKSIKDMVAKGIRASPMLEFHLEYPPKYPLPFFISYSSDARLKSFEALTREVHEVWIALRILKEFVKEMDFVWFQQSSAIPVAKIGNYSLWYEFDFTPHTMCEGILLDYCGSFNVEKCKEPLPQWLSQIYSRMQDMLKKPYSRAQEFLGVKLQGLRPDIMFTQAVSSCSDLFKSPTIAIKLIIECKNFDYEYWAKDVENQIIPYKKVFQPEHMIVASLKPVPQDVKKRLKSLGIGVVDHVYPGGTGEEKLIEYVKQALFSA
jgi:hypothetical protein